MKTQGSLFGKWMVLVVGILVLCSAPSLPALNESRLGAAVGFRAALAASSDLARARAQFSQGDIVAARDLLRRTAAQMPRGDREAGFKLLGICAFLTGQRDEARSAFEQAVKLNPRTQLDRKEVLDPSIDDFFEAVRASHAPKGGGGAGGSLASAKSAGSASGPTAKTSAAGSLPSLRRGATGLAVQTNAPQASVFANGLFVGTPGQAIELPPGSYQITVSAPNFLPSNQSIKLAQGDQITLRIELEDPVEKRRRELLVERERRRQAEAAAAAARALEVERQRQILEQEVARRRAEAELRELEREAAAARAREMAEAQRLEQERKQREVLALKAKALAAERELEKELARERAREQALTARPEPPPRSSKSSRSPKGQQASRDALRRESERTPPPPPRVQKRSSDKSAFLAVMPFGIGQFQNESYLLGTVSAILQVGALGWGVYSYALFTTTEEDFRRDSAATTLEQSYITEVKAYLDRWKTNSAIGFIGFGGVWALSGLEALISMNSSSRVSHHSNERPSLDAAPEHRFAWAPMLYPKQGGFGLQLRLELH